MKKNYPNYFLNFFLSFAVILVSSFSLLGQGFTDVNTVTGINFKHNGDPSDEAIMSVGSGAAWLDYNNDGQLDLYISQRYGANKLYHNNGDGTFTDRAAELGVQDITGDGAGVSIADFNNDGFEDIFLTNCETDRLFKNIGGVSFEDITATSGIAVTSRSRGTSASWGDYNSDGYLDLYIAHHAPKYKKLRPAVLQDFLLLNNGDETFTNVSHLLGDSRLLVGGGFIGSWTDFDNDGDIDIILINDCPVGPTPQRTLVFRNDGGADPLNWNFTEVSRSIGIDDCSNGMGIAVGDFNRDGWMDFFHTNIGEAILFQNNNGSFTDVTIDANVGTQSTGKFSWGTNFFDYDLDGWQDLYVVLGSLINRDANIRIDPNNLYRNLGDGINFEDVSVEMNMEEASRGRNSIFGDYDNDGDPDMFIVNYNEEAVLKRNDNNNGNHYLKIELVGTESNRDGIGAKIKITMADGQVQYFETRSGSSLGGGDALDAYFGLAQNTMVTEIEIKWPSSIIQIINNVSADQRITVVENEDFEPPSACNTPVTNPVEELSSTSAKISWANISSAGSYNLRYREEGTNLWTNILVNTIDYSLTDLTPEINYEFQVQANCDEISSNWSSIGVFILSDTPPPSDNCDIPELVNLTFNLRLRNSVFINITSIDGATNYKVKYRLVGSNNWSEISSASTNIRINNLIIAQSYELELAAFCSDEGWSNWSQTYTFVQGHGLSSRMQVDGNSTNELFANSEAVIKIFPNPGLNEVNIHNTGANTIDKILLMSATGKIIKELNPQSNQLKIDLFDFPKGMYFINITTDANERIIKKFVKI